MASPIIVSNSVFARPIANFHPDIWGGRFLNYTPDKKVVAKLKEEQESLKAQVRKLLLTTTDKPSDNLQLIDTIERLGIAYHFEKEIEELLSQIYDAYKGNPFQVFELDIYHTSLKFRILRQHGYYILSDIFAKFTDEHGSFVDSIKDDTRGLLSLYEAAHLRRNGEDILEKAVEFTTTQLKVIATNKDHPLAPQIARALVYPNHKGAIRIESRHYISYYEQDPSHRRMLLRFSKLDFSLNQSIHREEIQDLIKWWRSFKFEETLPFIRHRVVEAYLFATQVFLNPKLSVARKIYTKAFTVLGIMDDIYDAYGTLDELEPLTKAIERWEKDCLDELPTDYMKLFCVILFDTYKQFECELARLGRINYVQYSAKEVITLSKAYIQEARWREEKYIPTFEEYLDHGIRSSAVTLMFSVSLLDNEVEQTVANEAFQCVSTHCKPDRSACVIGRFMNDLADHKVDKQRAHVAGVVDCYIKQHGVSEEEAEAAVTLMVENAWKDLNEEIVESVTPLPKTWVANITNFCRAIDYVYNNKENGLSIVNQRMKETIELLFIEPLTL